MQAQTMMKEMASIFFHDATGLPVVVHWNRIHERRLLLSASSGKLFCHEEDAPHEVTCLPKEIVDIEIGYS